MASQDRSGESGEVPWLREMADDDLLGLFSDRVEEVARTARLLAGRAAEDPSTTERLIETLRASIEYQNDDTEASAWMALILGEIRDTAALPVLFLALGGADEALQEASRDAILKMGPPAIEALLEAIEEEPSPEFVEAGYRLLGMVGSFRDRWLRERAMEFLAERVEREAAKPPGECRIESLFQASALLGDRRMIAPMDRLLRLKFAGTNALIQDARDMLAENTGGEPLVQDPLPWVEAHRWLFEEDLEASRVKGRAGGRPDSSEEDEREGVDPSDYYWGLSFHPPSTEEE